MEQIYLYTESVDESIVEFEPRLLPHKSLNFEKAVHTLRTDSLTNVKLSIRSSKDCKLTKDQIRELWGTAIQSKDLSIVHKLRVRIQGNSGKGKIVYKGGLMYIGQYSNYMPQGFGMLSLKDNVILLKGNWESGALINE